jgi:conjugal transfer ATP-binding protein TraC
MPAPAETFAALAPLQADTNSFGAQPIIPLISRRGQIFYLDLLNSDTNYNGVVIAPSGSGKSFFTNNIITNYLSVGGRAFVIDIGRSYEKLCKTLGGQYIEFTEESDICLNIFSEMTPVLWRADTSELKSRRDQLRATCESILFQMVNPGTEITETEQSILSRCLGECYDEIENDSDFSIIDRMIAKLKQAQERNNEQHQSDNIPGHLAERLHRYGSNGKHANWFKGRYNIEFGRSFIVLELEELANSEDLKQVVLMLIMASIDHKLYIEADRSRPTAIIMDEAWAMLTGANTAKFIETGFRRARKYKGSFIIITQSIFDLRDKNPDIGNAILSNSAYRFLLQPKGEEARRAIEEGLLPQLSQYELNMLLSTHTSRGLYSEIFIIYPNGSTGVGRLHVNKFTELLYSTNPSEIELINTFRDRGFTLTEAINRAVGVLPLLRGGASIGEILSVAGMR